MKTYNWNSDESYSEWIDDVMKLLSIPSTQRFAFCGEHGETLDLNWSERVTPDVVAFLILRSRKTFTDDDGEPFFLLEGKQEMDAVFASLTLAIHHKDFNRSPDVVAVMKRVRLDMSEMLGEDPQDYT